VFDWTFPNNILTLKKFSHFLGGCWKLTVRTCKRLKTLQHSICNGYISLNGLNFIDKFLGITTLEAEWSSLDHQCLIRRREQTVRLWSRLRWSVLISLKALNSRSAITLLNGMENRKSIQMLRLGNLAAFRRSLKTTLCSNTFRCQEL
jgi:hypothetical protein